MEKVSTIAIESGNYVRYASGEALGVTRSDSYPTGYGFNDETTHYSNFNKGPFFPSVHSSSGYGPCSSCGARLDCQPDVVGGSPHYTHHGCYGANIVGKTGQTSIWFQ